MYMMTPVLKSSSLILKDYEISSGTLFRIKLYCSWNQLLQMKSTTAIEINYCSWNQLLKLEHFLSAFPPFKLSFYVL